MKRVLIDIHMKKQPNDVTCGPTCLHAVYNFYNDQITLDEVMSGVDSLEGGGTLATTLGIHALKRGYDVSLYTYNLIVFDPTWFLPTSSSTPINLIDKIREQKKYKPDHKIQVASDYYMKFLDLGGKILYQDLTKELLQSYLERKIPILTGLSATYLYQCPREMPNTDFDDILGVPSGHFVILTGYDFQQNSVLVADPWEPVSKDIFGSKYYWVKMERAISSILLGIVTYDGNFLIIQKK
jgi:hypothetical protein